MENAEGSAYAIWAQDYRRQKRAELEVAAVEGHSRAFGAALPFLAGGTLLFAVMATGERTVPVSDFLVVYIVFIAFQSAVARLGESFGAIAGMLPAFDQMRPLLAAVPEQPDVLVSLCGALYNMADDTNFDAVVAYATRLRREIGEFLVTMCLQRDPGLQNTAGFIRWAARRTR